MPSLGDSAVIILLGLLLFGPKGLAQIARQLGKLMGEFRRASNEFRMQMEEELRVSEQADRQKEIAAIQAAAPTPPPVLGSPTLDAPTPKATDSQAPAHELAPDLAPDDAQLRSIHPDHTPIIETAQATTADPTPNESIDAPLGEVEPLPIAVSGDFKIMPPATGLPQPRLSSSMAPLVDSIPHSDPTETAHHEHSDQRPNRYTNGHTDPSGLTDTAAEESLHG